jgi:heme ABC exporter ATP-binding subunit CcmA
MTVAPLIRTSGVRKLFGAQAVLDGVSLDVRPGEAVALLGGNGAGKTTLLKIVATVMRPTSGIVSVAGHDCVREAEAVRRVLGFAGHGAWVYDDLTAYENLKFWTTLHGCPVGREELTAALTALDLERTGAARVRTFSAGMKRRLSLARLTLFRPQALLLDEPFSGLDQRAKKWLEGYLEAFKSRGGALLMVTHSFGRELGVADRIAMLAAGHIVLDTPRAGLDPDDLQRLYAAHAEDVA